MIVLVRALSIECRAEKRLLNPLTLEHVLLAYYSEEENKKNSHKRGVLLCQIKEQNTNQCQNDKNRYKALEENKEDKVNGEIINQCNILKMIRRQKKQ